MASFLIALLNVISVMESANDNLTVGVSWSHFISSSINCVLPLPCRGGLSQISHGRGPKRNTTQIEVNDVTIAIDRIACRCGILRSASGSRTRLSCCHSHLVKQTR